MCFSTALFSQTLNYTVDTLKSKEQFISLDSLKSIYEREAIYLQGTHYVKGGEKFAQGIFQEKLLKEFSKSEEAKIEVQKFKRLKSLSAPLLLIATIGVTSSIAVLNPVLSLVFLIPDFAALYFDIKAVKHLEKARWLYNRDVVINGAKSMLK